MADENSTPKDETQAGEAQAGAGECRSGQHDCPYPQVTFSTFILSLSSSALVHLGEVPDPDTGQTLENLPLAKHTVDIIAMLKEKTQSCLDADESKLIDGILYELRMKYVMHRK